MKKNCRLFDYILLILALLSLTYFIIVSVNSRFITAYILYLIFSVLLAGFSGWELYFKTSILSKLPKIFNYSIKVLVIIFIVVVVIVEGLIIHEANNKYGEHCDYIIVLGARLYGDQPAPLLQYRLDAAVKYHKKYPDIPIIVSGGQGQGEDISEAEAMKKYLIDHGVVASVIIEENKSTNTNENIGYSKKIIEALTTTDYDVVIITNGFHCYRSKLLADKHNINAHTYAAKEKLDTAPHYYLREFFGCLKDMILS